MANLLNAALKEEIRLAYLAGVGIRKLTRDFRVSRTTIRKMIRADGLVPTLKLTASPPTVQQGPLLGKCDFKLLEKLFRGSREPGPASDFADHIQSMAVEIANDLGVQGAADTLRLEIAMTQYLAFRRFYNASLETSEQSYAGPYAKSHDKQAKAVASFVTASNQAFTHFNSLIRELEVKYGKRGPDVRSGGVVVQQQVNVQVNETRGV